MLTYPKEISEYLMNVIKKSFNPAYLTVDKSGILTDFSSNITDYGLTSFEKGAPLDRQTFYFEGLLPLEKDAEIYLPHIKFENNLSADVYIFSQDDKDQIILFNEWEKEEEIFYIQQRSNEASLIKDKLNGKLRIALDEQTAMANSYGKFAPKELINIIGKEILSQPNSKSFSKISATFLVTSIQNAEELSSNITDKEIFEFINHYQKIINSIIKENKGFIEDFKYGQITAFFTGKIEDAVNSALQINKSLIEYNKTRTLNGYKEIVISTGINVGDVVLGAFGAGEKIWISAISGDLNYTTRLNQLNKLYKTSGLLTDTAYKLLIDKDRYNLRSLGKYRLKKSEPQEIYEIMDCIPSDDEYFEKNENKKVFENAVALFSKKKFKKAIKLFKYLRKKVKKDKTLDYFIKICKKEL